MPLLSCSAARCVYNADHYCSRGDIQVSGDNARIASETCCESFREAQPGEAKNAVTEPTGQACVSCTANSCRYNEGRDCHAQKVDISGASACQCRQTECSTFDRA